MSVGLGLALATLVALVAHRRGALTASGAATAMIVASTTFVCGGWTWSVVLLFFFVSASAVSSFRAAHKRGAAELSSKGSRRDHAQVLAKGGIGAALALSSSASMEPQLFAAFLGATASAAADTWATELGVLSASRPRLITTLGAVEPGTSGAVSGLGTLAALAGALAVGVVATSVRALEGEALDASWVAVAAAGGVAGALLDSLLGATLQARYRSSAHGRPTERAYERTANKRLGGFAWLDNDVVNLVSTIGGAAVSAAVFAASGR